MKPRNKKLSFKSYLLIIFLSFSALLLITLWLFQTVFLDSFYKAIKTTQVKGCNESIVNHIDENDLVSVIKDIEQQNAMSVLIYDSSENIFAPIYAPQNIDGQHNKTLSMSNIISYYKEAKENGGKVTVSSKDDKGFDYKKPFQDDRFDSLSPPPLENKGGEYLACASITQKGDKEYFILVESMITPVTSVVETLRYQLIIMTVILVIISIVIAVITALKISKPIAKTNEKSKELANQNYDVEFSGGTFKEICELNDTLNTTAKELKKVDGLRKELIANISHDLRTPLTMITGYSEIMRDIPGENNPQNVQIIIDEATRLSDLVSDLLDISKYDSDTPVLNKTVFCLTDCIRRIFYRYSKLVDSENYHIIFENDEDVFVFADELKITQVIYNLINNAINYIGEDKTVTVKQTVQDNKVRIDIIDHGEGISEEDQKYIWDRYYKVDKEHKQAKIGTGLGLSIVRKILDLHNAEYGVISRVGEGSDFYIILDKKSCDE